jgi:hypothetical protein
MKMILLPSRERIGLVLLKASIHAAATLASSASRPARARTGGSGRPLAALSSGTMPKRDGHEHSLPAQLRTLPAAVRAIVQAARHAVKGAAPDAIEVGCQMAQPRSKSMMWKLCRYAREDEEGYVVAIGAFTNHASIFFARGAELDDGSGILEGSGKQLRYFTLRTPADAERTTVKRLMQNAFRLGTGKPSRSTR